MANRNFFIHNGLTVGSFSVDAATGNLISTGTVTLTTTTNASSPTTGALVVAGGIGVGGNVNVNGNLTVAGTVNATISGSITTATNLTGGAAGSLPYQTGAGQTTFRAIGAAGSILQSDGTAPQWVTTASLFGSINVASATPAVRGTVFGFTDSVCCNVSLGWTAGNTNITGYGNVAIGWQAGLSTDIGSTNVAIGYMALTANTSGSNNVGIGFRALCANTTGFQNVGIGFRALYGNTSGINNIAIGGTALFNNTTGCQNIAVGNLALAANRNGNGNIAIGCAALRNANSPSNNVALGFNAGCAVTTGASNVIIGANTGSIIATAQCNILLSDGQGTLRLRINESGATAFDTAGTAFGSAGQIMCSSGNAAPPGWVSQSSITAGSATNIAGGSGGTIPYQTAAGVTAMLAQGTLGSVLVTGVGGAAPSWSGQSSLNVGTATNLAGGTAGQLPYQSGIGTTAFAGPGTAGQLLQSAGTGAPTYVNTASLAVGFANRIIGGTVGQLLYQSAGNTTAFAGPGTAGQLLVSAGAAAPTYTNTASINVGNATCAVSAQTAGSATLSTCATNLAAGTAGQIAYQSGPNATSFAGPGTAGQLLVSAGAAAPTYTNTASINVGNATCAVSAQTAGSASAATNLSAGLGGSIPFQRSAGTTDFIGIGTAGFFLVSNGTTATWVSTATLGISSGVSTPATPSQLGLVFGYTTGAGNVAIGCCAGNLSQSGTDNFASGCCTLKSNTLGTANIAIGLNALTLNTTGNNNLALGYKALESNTTGNNNFAAGCLALNKNNQGCNNVAIGSSALCLNISGSDNVAIGSGNLGNNLGGNCNIAIGYSNLISNTCGGTNIAIGRNQLQYLNTGSVNIAIGDYNLFCNTCGSLNIAVGASNLWYNTSGCSNIAIGYSAAYNNRSGNFNIAIGDSALRNNSAGSRNIAIGCGALYYSTQTENLAIGDRAGWYLEQGIGNTFIGTDADNGSISCYTLVINAGGCQRIRVDNTGLRVNGVAAVAMDACNQLKVGTNVLASSTGINNFGVGYEALKCNITGLNNTAIGCGALYSNTLGSNNTAIGNRALYGNTTGNNNTAVGYGALKCNITSSNNTAIGCFALYCNQGSNNLAVGYFSMFDNAVGNNNVAIGQCSLGKNTSGCDNLAIGQCALLCNNTGVSNIALGYSALYRNTSGSDNLAIGCCTLYGNTIGNDNIAIGFEALKGNTSGSLNIAIGYGSLRCNITGCYNTAIGINALSKNTVGLCNFAVGWSALGCVTSGCNNIGIGNSAGNFLTTGNNNTIIGNLLGAADLNCTVLIGAGNCERLKICNNCFALNGQRGFRAFGSNYSWETTTGFPASACWNNAAIEIPSIYSVPGSGVVGWTIDMTATNILRIGSGNVYNAPNLMLSIACTGEISIPSAANASSSSTGAIQTAGGLGIGGNIYVGGGSICGNTGCNLTLTMGASLGTTRSINICGQPGYTVAGPGGPVNITGGIGQSSTNGTGGSICVTGGAATVGNWDGGNVVLIGGAGVGTGCRGMVNVASDRAAISTQSAALIVLGGVGIGHNLITNGQLCASSGRTYNWATNGIWASGAGVWTQSISSVIGTNGWTIDMTATNILRIGSGSVTGVPGSRLSICSNGDVNVSGLGVGTVASGVAGEIRATDNITAYYSSDCRLKTNITPIPNALCRVNQISGVLYDWNDEYIARHGGEDGVFVRKRDVGLIAQEIEKILPEIVVDRSDGYKAIKYERVVALLVEAIKELKLDFDNLQKLVSKE